MHRVCQLAGLTVCLLAVVAAHTLHARPPRIGFLAMRGKRNASWLGDGGERGGQLMARSRRFSYPIHRLIRLDDLYQDLYTRADRTPFGFTGLRGKKAPSGFGGLRGKKSSSGFGGLRGKRIPNGFGGLRGKRIPSGFSGLRGRRIPNGFSGLRGKKIPNGFSGLRGKKIPNGLSGLRGKRPLDGGTEPDGRLATQLLELNDLPVLDALRRMHEEAEEEEEETGASAVPNRPLPEQSGPHWREVQE